MSGRFSLRLSSISSLNKYGGSSVLVATTKTRRIRNRLGRGVWSGEDAEEGLGADYMLQVGLCKAGLLGAIRSVGYYSSWVRSRSQPETRVELN
eukprot:9309541-Pyramimonas_sp.AAC.1